jgi:NAD+ kinase
VTTEPTTRESAEPRRVLLLAHVGREQARDVARQFAGSLGGRGLVVRLLADEAEALGLRPGPDLELVERADDAASGCELVVVIGGDGSILRAAELTHETDTPLLGINLGHVGFLAEAELADLGSTIEAIADREYLIEDRLTVGVTVHHEGRMIYDTFALNEASVEKAARERMIELVLEIDGRPLSRWGCDGVVCATPTGSTAYNFSAGGPVVWPGVQALCVVPLSAHALFARPMVVAPDSVVALERGPEAARSAVLWCDGRRSFDLPRGARVEVRRGARPVRLVRLRDEPFTDRLVAKFGLPVTGWRGARESRDA